VTLWVRASVADGLESSEGAVVGVGESAEVLLGGLDVRLDLRFTKPPVWRRLVLPGDLTLGELHSVIQGAMGWYDSHLHRFRTGADHNAAYFITEFDLDEGDEGIVEDQVRLDQVIAEVGDGLWC
jgi:hypothetical protein